ncbi:hypothetical protein D3C87_1463470 [compost metagenome]|uniref:Uncharacterized protein n=1 Tax=Solitalea canadensis (strain ATCC 29591 / DSM 3403 / JCM 21819 / LMG 8368 / NBRC 15130 / NCIMB 12057 / USAM 9D) TaxID=929556 RepID=H8KR44_SOLCM|nr:hypothetical protein [Solitalea canadensis]AFD07250.1 hypothetical protein Solca_2204 [Solitalea canadensis DSM 3403]
MLNNNLCYKNVLVPTLNPTLRSNTLEVGQECWISINNPRPDEGNLHVTVTITDACGITTTINNTYYITGLNLTMYPNPANEQITISLMDENI